MIDPFEELRSLAGELEARGVPNAEIVDACFRLAVTAATRMNGRETVALALYDMAALVAGEKETEAARLTRH
jgi:hypothetical protein